MSDYGITPTGFNRKRLNLLLDEINGEMKAIFGENFNVSPESPDGQINGITSESRANLWEIAEEVYNAFNPSSASGITLSNLVQLNGITRLEATPSRAELLISGTSGTVIPEGSSVSTVDSEIQFLTEEEVSIGGGGTVTVYASSSETGPLTALAGTITNIDNPVTGWDSVTNPSDAIIGTNEETDVELRARRQKSVSKTAQAVIDAIFGAVANIDGVTNLSVLENDTLVTDSNGTPPKSFHVIVVGGIDEEIAEAIWLKKPAGILSFGTTTVVIYDSQNIPHNISFSRPVSIDIYVDIEINTFDDFPADGEEQIKQAIVDYANGDLIEGRSFSLADDVIYTRLYTPINYVPGHEIVSLKIGTSPSPIGTSNIPIGATEISNFLTTNIIVTVAP